MQKGLNVFFAMPPSCLRMEVFQSSEPEMHPGRFLLYGMDAAKARGYDVRCNLDACAGRGSVRNLICSLYSLIVARVVGYAGNLDWIIGSIRRMNNAGVQFLVSGNIALAVVFLRVFGVLRRRKVVFLSIGLHEQIEQVREGLVRRAVIRELRMFERIICLSKTEYDELADKYGFKENLVFMPAGVDVNVFAPSEDPPSVDVLSIGADKYRDHELLVEAARLFADKKVLLVTTAQAMASLRDVPSNMQIVCDVPIQNIPAYLNSASIVAIPVKQNLYSGGTTVMLQAMASGKPVIASNVGANRSGYYFKDDENCVLIEPGDGVELESQLKSLLADSDRRLRIGASARKLCLDKLSLESFHDRLMAILGQEIGLEPGVAFSGKRV